MKKLKIISKSSDTVTLNVQEILDLIFATPKKLSEMVRDGRIPEGILKTAFIKFLRANKGGLELFNHRLTLTFLFLVGEGLLKFSKMEIKLRLMPRKVRLN